MPDNPPSHSSLPASAAGTGPGRVLANVEKLTEKIGGTLVRLADVPPQNRTQFLHEVNVVLTRWMVSVSIWGDEAPPKERDRSLRQMLRNVEAVHKQLSEIVDAFQTGHRFEPLTPAAFLSYRVGERLNDALRTFGRTETDRNMQVWDILPIVSFLRGGIETALNSRTRSIEGYPSLDAMVIGLAHAARRAGGKFSAHRTNGGKGSLIEALDEIKSRWPNVEEFGAKLADALPSPDQHPIATYERLLSDAPPSHWLAG
jgi:hypothetical protein